MKELPVALPHLCERCICLAFHRSGIASSSSDIYKDGELVVHASVQIARCIYSCVADGSRRAGDIALQCLHVHTAGADLRHFCSSMIRLEDLSCAPFFHIGMAVVV